MGWPKLLMLARHAESDGNVRSVDERARYDVATYDYGITDRGRRQAEITGKHLKKEYGTFDVRYVSYYRRSKETMEILCPGERVYEDPRLAEGQRGIWHTTTEAEMAARYPGEIERKKREGLYHYRPLGGENWPDIELRIHSFLGTLSRDCEGEKVLMVVHGHWLILLQRLLEHYSIEEAMQRYKGRVVENCSLTCYSGKIRRGCSRLKLEFENRVPWQGLL